MSKEDSKVAGKERSASQDGREEILGTLGNDATIGRLMNLALVFDDQGHPKLAEQVYEEVMQKRRETPRQEDQVLLFCQGKISSIQRQCGLYMKAEDQCMRVLEHSRLNPLLSLQTAGNLALVWRDQGKFDLALKKISDILGKETCSLYEDAVHLRLVTILAIILRDCGEHDMSSFLIRNALRVSDELYGNEDPFTLDLASELSQILTEQKKYGLAEEFARGAFDGFGDKFGTDHPQSLKASTRLANAMPFEKRLGDATELFEQTLKAQELQLGSTHPDTVPTKCGLAATYALGARFRDSLSILRPTLDQQKALFGRNPHPDTDWTLQAIDQIEAIQKALVTSENKIREQSQSMRRFFTTPFRQDRRKLQLYDEASVRGIYGTNLHAACFKGDLKSVQELLETREDCNAQSGIFETPLRAASYGGHIEIVSSLLQHNANARDCGKNGFSALQLAVSMGHRDIVDRLLHAGANLEDTDHWYGTILHEASMTGQEHMVNTLLDAKAKPNAVTGIFGTALGAAAWNGSLTIVESLIAKGAIVDSQVEGRTGVDLAASRGYFMQALKEAATNSHGTLKSKEKSKTVGPKSLEQERPLVGNSKPAEQPLKPTEPQKPRNGSLRQYKKAGKGQAGKTQAGKTKAGKEKGKLMNFAKDVTSATKRRIYSLRTDPRSKLVNGPAKA